MRRFIDGDPDEAGTIQSDEVIAQLPVTIALVKQIIDTITSFNSEVEAVVWGGQRNNPRVNSESE